MRTKSRMPKKKGYRNFEDNISQMPDEILHVILSRLPAQEAAATSLLSSRWRYLSTYITWLDFEANASLNKIAAQPKLLTAERSKYINRVNRVLRNHKGGTIDTFNICFDLDKTSKSAIDRWIKFALEKKVENLELNLLEKGETLRYAPSNYTFPYKLLTKAQRSSSKKLHPNATSVKPLPLLELKSLKDLSLKCVNIGDDALEYVLLNCPLLERLSLHGAKDLTHVRINGPSLRLRSVEIVVCYDLETVDICDTNVVRFRYYGNPVVLRIENVPRLDEIDIGVESSNGLESYVFGQISWCLNQLVVLTLDIYHPKESIVFPRFPKVKDLTLILGAWDDDSILIMYASLLEQCPYLENFQLQLKWVSPCRTQREPLQPKRTILWHLKYVEISGYYGRVSDAEFAEYLFQNAPGLKRMVIDPQHPYRQRAPTDDVLKKENDARKCAIEQLTGISPPTVSTFIL